MNFPFPLCRNFDCYLAPGKKRVLAYIASACIDEFPSAASTSGGGGAGGGVLRVDLIFINVVTSSSLLGPEASLLGVRSSSSLRNFFPGG